MQAYPYPGVAERLAALAATPGVTVALVSGRPVAELSKLLPLAEQLEVFGSHGREHRAPDGSYHLAEIAPEVRGALDDAERQLRAAGWSAELERKAGSLALHWRGLSAARAEEARKQAEHLFASFHGGGQLATLVFDGGLELRATDATKAHAVEQLLRTVPGVPTAFLGDDTTDEDAFHALRAGAGERGLSLLVRAEARLSEAPYSLRPPGELLSFLDDWLHAAQRRG